MWNEIPLSKSEPCVYKRKWIKHWSAFVSSISTPGLSQVTFLCSALHHVLCSLCEMFLDATRVCPCLTIWRVQLTIWLPFWVTKQSSCGFLLSAIHILEAFWSAFALRDLQPAPLLSCQGNFMHVSGTSIQHRWNCKVTCRHTLPLRPTQPWLWHCKCKYKA